MGKPKIADNKPAVLTLAPGTYWWCSCGKSENQPYCDGKHQGTDFTPVELEITEEQRVALCLCKHTARPPFCDGAHVKL